MSPQCTVTALTVLISQMTYIYPAGSLLHSQSITHRAFVIVELYQPVWTIKKVGKLFTTALMEAIQEMNLWWKTRTTP